MTEQLDPAAYTLYRTTARRSQSMTAMPTLSARPTTTGHSNCTPTTSRRRRPQRVVAVSIRFLNLARPLRPSGDRLSDKLALICLQGLFMLRAVTWPLVLGAALSTGSEQTEMGVELGKKWTNLLPKILATRRRKPSNTSTYITDVQSRAFHSVSGSLSYTELLSPSICINWFSRFRGPGAPMLPPSCDRSFRGAVGEHWLRWLGTKFTRDAMNPLPADIETHQKEMVTRGHRIQNGGLPVSVALKLPRIWPKSCVATNWIPAFPLSDTYYDMATAESSPPSPSSNSSVGPGGLAICSPLFALGLILYTIRIVTRVRPTYKLRCADYVISAAILFETLTFSFFACAISYGLGRHSYFVLPQNTAQVIRWLFGVQIAGMLASTLARVAIPLLLLDFMPDSAAWKTTLWVSITVQVMALLTNVVYVFAACQPTRAMWEVVADAHCAPPAVGWIVGYIFCGVTLICDILYAIMPGFAITKLSRPAIERGLIWFLMALCLAATAASIMKIYLMKLHDYTSPDVLRSMYRLSFWCRLEELLLIIASSAPFAKPAVERILSQFNLPTFGNLVRRLDTYHSKSTMHPNEDSSSSTSRIHQELDIGG
ncbi:hypothetical protein EDB81DRAFT_932474 [Dactylonectria macrodidyma]|uniref:Rhodopsin domain-containing protein n=1 Tax=Dactylonectria macrodidyma TaxID=307937 RepID=A0A9P9EX63_9HYPO|nr:hypothetical protein EDB81DRAFT_932474 [Dactylonectria macrodidyma]